MGEGKDSSHVPILIFLLRRGPASSKWSSVATPHPPHYTLIIGNFPGDRGLGYRVIGLGLGSRYGVKHSS